MNEYLLIHILSLVLSLALYYLFYSWVRNIENRPKGYSALLLLIVVVQLIFYICISVVVGFTLLGVYIIFIILWFALIKRNNKDYLQYDKRSRVNSERIFFAILYMLFSILLQTSMFFINLSSEKISIIILLILSIIIIHRLVRVRDSTILSVILSICLVILYYIVFVQLEIAQTSSFLPPILTLLISYITYKSSNYYNSSKKYENRTDLIKSESLQKGELEVDKISVDVVRKNLLTSYIPFCSPIKRISISLKFNKSINKADVWYRTSSISCKDYEVSGVDDKKIFISVNNPRYQVVKSSISKCIQKAQESSESDDNSIDSAVIHIDRRTIRFIDPNGDDFISPLLPIYGCSSIDQRYSFKSDVAFGYNHTATAYLSDDRVIPIQNQSDLSEVLKYNKDKENVDDDELIISHYKIYKNIKNLMKYDVITSDRIKEVANEQTKQDIEIEDLSVESKEDGKGKIDISDYYDISNCEIEFKPSSHILDRAGPRGKDIYHIEIEGDNSDSVLMVFCLSDEKVIKIELD